jgi:hypothetical protein
VLSLSDDDMATGASGGVPASSSTAIASSTSASRRGTARAATNTRTSANTRTSTTVAAARTSASTADTRAAAVPNPFQNRPAPSRRSVALQVRRLVRAHTHVIIALQSASASARASNERSRLLSSVLTPATPLDDVLRDDEVELTSTRSDDVAAAASAQSNPHTPPRTAASWRTNARALTPPRPRVPGASGAMTSVAARCATCNETFKSDFDYSMHLMDCEPAPRVSSALSRSSARASAAAAAAAAPRRVHVPTTTLESDISGMPSFRTRPRTTPLPTRTVSDPAAATTATAPAAGSRVSMRASTRSRAPGTSAATPLVVGSQSSSPVQIVSSSSTRGTKRQA